AEGEELKLIYEAKGLSPSEAETMVRHLLADRASAIDALTHEELGIDPKGLGGSAWEAAVTSFVLFAIGAAVPILPFVVARGSMAVASSVVLSAVGLFVSGARSRSSRGHRCGGPAAVSSCWALRRPD